jgi:hypothetical protein
MSNRWKVDLELLSSEGHFWPPRTPPIFDPSEPYISAPSQLRVSSHIALDAQFCDVSSYEKKRPPQFTRSLNKSKKLFLAHFDLEYLRQFQDSALEKLITILARFEIGGVSILTEIEDMKWKSMIFKKRFLHFSKKSRAKKTKKFFKYFDVFHVFSL